MRIISYNVNGVRAAIKKGLVEWLSANPTDIICLQEIKANQEDIPAELFHELGFETYWFSAQKKGYSGVGILTKIKPDKVLFGTGLTQSDFEGRVIRADFGDLTLVNAYFPSGTSGDERQTYKYQWLDEFYNYLLTLRKERPNLIVTGDYNICHKAIDIHDPIGNKNSSGFLPDERVWMDKFFEAGFVDTLRHFNPQPNLYTWWSLRANSRERNKGWRIDYINVTEPLKPLLKSATILPHIKHSDHCPVFLEINR